MGISQSLPQTGYVKMIDIWMIFTMSYPFFVIACHCGIEVILYLYVKAHPLFFSQVLAAKRMIGPKVAWSEKISGKIKYPKK